MVAESTREDHARCSRGGTLGLTLGCWPRRHATHENGLTTMTENDTAEGKLPNHSGRWYQGPYLLLTLALVLTVILHPIMETLFGGNMMNVLLTLLLLAGLRAISGHRWLFRIMGAMVLPVLAANWLVDYLQSAPIIDWSASIITQLFLLVVMGTVFWDVIKTRKVTADVIFGSVAVYLIFGVVMAMIYQLINTIDPGTVIASVTADDTARTAAFDQFLYFSFITLTSVGFGDLSPLGQYARSLAVFEGVVGQLYLAILVARLVGAHLAQE
jgi:hypothetical protein